MKDWLTSSSCSGRRAFVRTRCRSAAECGRRFRRRSPTNLPIDARGPWGNLSAGGWEEFWRLEWASIVYFVEVAVDSTRTRSAIRIRGSQLGHRLRRLPSCGRQAGEVGRRSLANARFGDLSADAAFYTSTVQANKAKQNVRLVQRTVRVQV